MPAQSIADGAYPVRLKTRIVLACEAVVCGGGDNVKPSITVRAVRGTLEAALKKAFE